MKKHEKSEPNRPLSINFTDRTLKRAIKAKRRESARASLRGVFIVKKQFLKQPVGVLVALGLVVLGGAGAYAATNWFNGSIGVKEDQTILTVDLSECKSAVMPAGIEPAADRREVKFKILGDPHIGGEKLEKSLLADCEMQAVREFYKQQYGGSLAEHFGMVKKVDLSERTVTLSYTWGGSSSEMTWRLDNGAQLYDKGQPAELAQFKEGDTVVFAYDLGGYIEEGQDPFKKITSLRSLFKMQYDTSQAMGVTKAFYDESNIMPLDWYNQIHKK